MRQPIATPSAELARTAGIGRGGSAELRIAVDVTDLTRLGERFKRAGAQGPRAYRLALNRTGDRSATEVRRALSQQMKLQQRVIGRALRRIRATSGRLSYEIRATGRELALKYFSPRETRRGTIAQLPTGAKTFPHAFMRGGKFPRRKTVARFHGHVFERAGSSRKPISKVMSGLSIPSQMVIGESRAAFFRVVRTEFPKRLEHELNRLLAAR